MNNVYIVGTKQTIKAIKNRNAKKCYIALDADERIKNELIILCKDYNVPIVYVNTMKELGKMCKINIGAASAVE